MANTPVSESEVKAFIRDWFHKLDKHPDPAQMLPLVADKALKMNMPEGKYEHHDGFKKWYRGVDRYRDQIHTVKASKIETSYYTATVKVINRWERSDSEAPNPETRLAFYAAQTWTLERSPQTQRLLIIAYNIYYFLPEEDLEP